MTDTDFPYMRDTGQRDRGAGRRYQCTLCGKKVWTAFGNARKHADRGRGCSERDDRGRPIRD